MAMVKRFLEIALAGKNASFGARVVSGALLLTLLQGCYAVSLQAAQWVRGHWHG